MYFLPWTCRLQEVCEHIELLDAAIDYKNQSIAAHNVSINWIVHGGGEMSQAVHDKIAHLPPAEVQVMLAHYFNKVVQLWLHGSQQKESMRRLEARLSEQKDMVHRMERALKQAQAEAERRLLLQQKVCICHNHSP